MGKYLHRFFNEEDFIKAYYDEGEREVIAITISMAGTYPTCADMENVELTEDYNGRYVFDHESDFPPTTACTGEPMPPIYKAIKVFKNGNKEIFAIKADFGLGEEMWSYEMEGQPMAFIIQDFSNFGQAGDGMAMISSIEYGEETVGGYHEPWVSATNEKKILTRINGSSENAWYEYEGEVDVYEGQQS